MCITRTEDYRIRYLKHSPTPREYLILLESFSVCNRFCYLTILPSCTSFIFHNQHGFCRLSRMDALCQICKHFSIMCIVEE